MLETHELGVDMAENAEDALTYLTDNRPDIIFMDHQMPGMDGLEAVSTIKNNPATASIPIMMYTAQKGEVYVGQARALGAAGVLPKQIEPVEVSKVLEKLHIIGRNAEHRRRSNDTDATAVTASGAYPSLEKFDRDLKVLIQELFDQQRAILRRDLLDSQELIAARVADEIRPAEIDADEVILQEPDKDIPSPLQVVTAILAGVAMILGWLYWQAENSREEIQEQNAALEGALAGRKAIGSQDTLQNQQQIGDYQRALENTRDVALDSIEWAANQSSHYSIHELPMDDFRLSVITEVSDRLVSLDYRGLIRIESHVGDFCMSFAGPDGYALAADDLPVIQCDRLGFESTEAYEIGHRQSVAFANFIATTDERTGGKIRFQIVSSGNSNPLLNYPGAAESVTAATWNDIAASNNRVEVTLHPD